MNKILRMAVALAFAGSVTFAAMDHEEHENKQSEKKDEKDKHNKKK